MTTRLILALFLVLSTVGPFAHGSALAIDVNGYGDRPQLADYPDASVDTRASKNGCGPAEIPITGGDGGYLVPDDPYPNVSFTPACDWHDQCYGTKGMSQAYCDRGMYARSLAACGDAPFLTSSCQRTASFYYGVVSLGGGGPHASGQTEACDRDPTRDGRIHGDPHIQTVDGLAYSLMTVGDFTVLEHDGNDIVQARFHPLSESFTVIRAVAVRIGNQVVTIAHAGDDGLSVAIDGAFLDGIAARLDGGVIEVGEEVEGVGHVVTVRRDDGLRVEALAYPDRFDLGINVPEGLWGNVQGLMGDADGDPSNDLIDADGRSIEVLDIYESDNRHTWRVPPDQSLLPADANFDYHGDEARAYPIDPISGLDRFDPSEIAEARRSCEANGLTGNDLEFCVYDVLVSGISDYAVTSARSARRAEAVAHPDSMLPAPDNSSQADVPPADPSPSGFDMVGSSRLLLAARQGDLQTMSELLEGGVNPDEIQEGANIAALTYAALVNDVEMARLLLEAGADPNLGTPKFPMRTALHQAVQLPESSALVELLLEFGADPNRQGEWPSSAPLHGAAQSNAADSVSLLLEAGADVDALTDDPEDGGVTPLAMAVQSNAHAVAQLLVDAGADVDFEVFGTQPLRDVAWDDAMRRILDG